MTALPRCSALVGAILLAGCGAGGHRYAPVDTAKVIDSIKSDEVRWNDDWRSGDPARLAAHFSPDGVMMQPGMAPATGAAAIRSTLAKLVSQPGFGLTFASDHVDVAASGDLAVAHGTYSETLPDPQSGAAQTHTGAYVTVYKPEPDGVWKATEDIVAAAAPDPAGAPPAARP